MLIYANWRENANQLKKKEKKVTRNFATLKWRSQQNKPKTKHEMLGRPTMESPYPVKC